MNIDINEYEYELLLEHISLIKGYFIGLSASSQVELDEYPLAILTKMENLLKCSTIINEELADGKSSQ